jgi:hypothetical protein
MPLKKNTVEAVETEWKAIWRSNLLKKMMPQAGNGKT